MSLIVNFILLTMYTQCRYLYSPTSCLYFVLGSEDIHGVEVVTLIT